MSDLYRVSVQGAVGGIITMEVTTVHQDAGPPPLAFSFPTALLVDLWLETNPAVARQSPWGPRFQALSELLHGGWEGVERVLPDEDGFREEADALIASYVQCDARNQDAYAVQGEAFYERPPRVTLVVGLRDPVFAGFVRPAVFANAAWF